MVLRNRKIPNTHLKNLAALYLLHRLLLQHFLNRQFYHGARVKSPREMQSPMLTFSWNCRIWKPIVAFFSCIDSYHLVLKPSWRVFNAYENDSEDGRIASKARLSYFWPLPQSFTSAGNHGLSPGTAISTWNSQLKWYFILLSLNIKKKVNLESIKQTEVFSALLSFKQSLLANSKPYHITKMTVHLQCSVIKSFPISGTQLLHSLVWGLVTLVYQYGSIFVLIFIFPFLLYFLYANFKLILLLCRVSSTMPTIKLNFS